jgi:prepilin-type N-terminal cleavage/methylation domain-containing protein
MMLKTGNKGFTFLEVMAASSVLALGAVLIYEAFFISLDAFNYYGDYLNVASWADDMVWQAQAEVRAGGQVNLQTDGEFTRNNKRFRWNLSSNLLDADTGLYAIDLLLYWKTGKREMSLSRGTYEIQPRN